MNYLLWLAIFVLLPILTLFFFYKKALLKYKKSLFWAMFFALVFSIPWDIFAVNTKIWSFPEGKNIGIIIGNLPLEEFLFMIFVTLLIGCLTIISKYKKGAKNVGE